MTYFQKLWNAKIKIKEKKKYFIKIKRLTMDIPSFSAKVITLSLNGIELTVIIAPNSNRFRNGRCSESNGAKHRCRVDSNVKKPFGGVIVGAYCLPFFLIASNFRSVFSSCCHHRDFSLYYYGRGVWYGRVSLYLFLSIYIESE